MKRRHGRCRDDIAASLLRVAGAVASAVAGVLGRPDAGVAVQGVTAAAADAIRSRGVATDQIVEALRHIDAHDVPWNRGGKP